MDEYGQCLLALILFAIVFVGFMVLLAQLAQATMG